jgi:hypothetical protein
MVDQDGCRPYQSQLLASDVTMSCQTCGAPLPAGANYCPNCGRLVATAQTPPAKGGMPKWLLVVLIVGALFFVAIPFLGIFAAILIPNFLHARAESMMAANEGNLKMIATGLEEYAVDHNGKYPDHLPQLVPTYLKALPPVPGGDGTGAYDYHHPASPPGAAAYEIWDDGSMDPTTFGGIPRGANGPSCAGSCKYVVYRAGVGIIGVPGTSSATGQ